MPMIVAQKDSFVCIDDTQRPAGKPDFEPKSHHPTLKILRRPPCRSNALTPGCHAIQLPAAIQKNNNNGRKSGATLLMPSHSALQPWEIYRDGDGVGARRPLISLLIPSYEPQTSYSPYDLSFVYTIIASFPPASLVLAFSCPATENIGTGSTIYIVRLAVQQNL